MVQAGFDESTRWEMMSLPEKAPTGDGSFVGSDNGHDRHAVPPQGRNLSLLQEQIAFFSHTIFIFLTGF